jgi:hypothetical protein
MEGWLFALVHEKALEFTGRGWFSIDWGLLPNITDKCFWYLLGLFGKGLEWFNLLGTLLFLDTESFGKWKFVVVSGAVSVLEVEVGVIHSPGVLSEARREVVNCIIITIFFNNVFNCAIIVLIYIGIFTFVFENSVVSITKDWIGIITKIEVVTRIYGPVFYFTFNIYVIIIAVAITTVVWSVSLCITLADWFLHPFLVFLVLFEFIHAVKIKVPTELHVSVVDRSSIWVKLELVPPAWRKLVDSFRDKDFSGSNSQEWCLG